MNDVNRQLVLARRPVGAVEDSDFELRETDVPEPGPGEFLVRVLWISFDPAQRGWLNDVRSYIAPVGIGEVMRARAIGQVVTSNNDEFAVGDIVQGGFGWQDWAVSDGSGMWPVSRVPDGVPPTAMLGVLGSTGLTAYFGLLDVGQPQEDDTVLVSGAAGATGSIAGQIARVMGCRVIGIAGGDEKCAWVRDVARFDEVIDYKAEDVSKRLSTLAPEGIDVYFDNVGGPTLEAALNHLAMRARIALCGGISAYEMDTPPPGPRNYLQLIVKRARMEGFLVYDYAARFGEAIAELRRWVDAGEIRYAEDIQEGLENAPATLRRLFEGKNLGKQILKIADPPL